MSRMDNETEPKKPNNSKVNQADFNGESTKSNKNYVKSTVEKKRVGRPKLKTEEQMIINISIPFSLFQRMDVAKGCFGGNLTKYVNKVLEDDLNTNYKKYQVMNNSINGNSNN